MRRTPLLMLSTALVVGAVGYAPASPAAAEPAAQVGDTVVSGRLVDERGVTVNALDIWDPVGGASTRTGPTGAFSLPVSAGAVTLQLWDNAYQQFGFDRTITTSAVAGTPTRLGTVVLRSTPNPTRSSHAISTGSRKSVRQAVRKELRPALRHEKVLNPNGCRVRQVPRKAQQRVIAAVNFVRRLSGVDPVALDRSLSRKAQQAALIQYYQGYLSHYPSPRARCATKVGVTASGQSNLALGYRGAGVILGYMADPGSTNTAAGHRRWIQDPFLETMGTGQVGTANALYVFGPTSTANAAPTAVAWPTPGWFPAELEPGGRWSYSMSRTDVSFAHVKVRAVAAGKRLKLHRYPSAYGYGHQNSVVWDLASRVSVPRKGARTVTVKVSGLTQRGRALPAVSYPVRLFRA